LQRKEGGLPPVSGLSNDRSLPRWAKRRCAAQSRLDAANALATNRAVPMARRHAQL